MKNYLYIIFIAFFSLSFSAIAEVNPKQASLEVFQFMKTNPNKNQTDAVVDKYFSTKDMAVRVAGPTFRASTEIEKTNYLSSFDTYFKKNFYNLTQEYKFENIENLKEVINGDDGYVKADLVTKGKEKMDLSLPVEKIDGDWKIIDIKFLGISWISGLRGHCGSLSRKKGLAPFQEYFDKLIKE